MRKRGGKEGGRKRRTGKEEGQKREGGGGRDEDLSWHGSSQEAPPEGADWGLLSEESSCS